MDLAVAEEFVEGIFVDQRSPARVDDYRAGFHQFELFAPDDVVGPVGEGDNGGYYVGLLAEGVDVDELYAVLLGAFGGRVQGPGDDVHADESTQLHDPLGEWAPPPARRGSCREAGRGVP